MPSFKTHIFGNLPVQIDVDKEGAIEEVMVIGLQRELNPQMALYLELDDATMDKLQEMLLLEIHQCLIDHENERKAYVYSQKD